MTLRPLSDMSPADWFVGSADDPSTLITLGPSGFDQYARLLHPWDGRIAGAEEARVEGHLRDESLVALVDVLSRHTSTPGDCYHALWDGFGDIEGGEAVGFLTAVAGSSVWPGRIFRKPKPPPLPPPAFGPAVLSGPRLTLPQRDYLLFGGPLADAGRWGAASYGHGIPRNINSPNLLWPADHAWFMATGIDETWTGVGGSAALIDELLADPRLEVVRTKYLDSTGRS